MAAPSKTTTGPTISLDSNNNFMNVAATTNNWVDNNGNQLNAGAKSSFSTITATNHNYAGGGTPTIIVLNQQSGTATATAAGTIGATQYTPTGGVSATYVAEARLI